MPVDRTTRLSISQFSELLGIEPERLIDVTMDRLSSTVTLVLEPKEYAAGLGEIGVHEHTPQPEDWMRRGSLLLICPGCGNWTEFGPIVGDVPVSLRVAHQLDCQLSDVRALAEGRTPAGQRTVA